MPTVLRDPALVRFISLGCAIYSTGFAIAILCMGQLLTSKQWTYLLSIPGGKWSWAVLFGSAGITALAGLWKRRDHVTSCGLFCMTGWCLSIVGFYIIGPFYESSLLTLGFFPWAGCASLMAFMAFQNLSEHKRLALLQAGVET